MKLIDQMAHIIGEVRPVLMPRDLNLLPGRELGIGVAHERVGLGLQPRDLAVDLHRRVGSASWRSSTIFPSSSAIGFSKSR
ncbi:MAG: hypothetical protein WDM89_08005 [Rhizomicrobium sp.]